MRTSPCIVYMPRINQWWDILSESLKTTLMTTIQNLDPSSPILLLATSEEPLKQIDVWVSRIVMLYFDVDFSSVLSDNRISRSSWHKIVGLESSIYGKFTCVQLLYLGPEHVRTKQWRGYSNQQSHKGRKEGILSGSTSEPDYQSQGWEKTQR